MKADEFSSTLQLYSSKLSDTDRSYLEKHPIEDYVLDAVHDKKSTDNAIHEYLFQLFKETKCRPNSTLAKFSLFTLMSVFSSYNAGVMKKVPFMSADYSEQQPVDGGYCRSVYYEDTLIAYAYPCGMADQVAELYSSKTLLKQKQQNNGEYNITFWRDSKGISACISARTVSQMSDEQGYGDFVIQPQHRPVKPVALPEIEPVKKQEVVHQIENQIREENVINLRALQAFAEESSKAFAILVPNMIKKFRVEYPEL